MGIMTDFARPDGVASKGYLAMAGHDRPGIIVIQEWWGLNDQIAGSPTALRAPATTRSPPISTRAG